MVYSQLVAKRDMAHEDINRAIISSSMYLGKGTEERTDETVTFCSTARNSGFERKLVANQYAFSLNSNHRWRGCRR